jgi:hypothetical protein
VTVDRPAAKLEKPLVTVAAHCKAGDHCAAAAHCPPGTRWTPAKYGRAGKWRVAHCTTWKSQRPADSAANQLNAQEAARNMGGGMGPPGGMVGAPPAPVYGGPEPRPTASRASSMVFRGGATISIRPIPLTHQREEGTPMQAVLSVPQRAIR